MAINFLVQIAIALAVMAIGFVMMPKPKTPKPDAVRDMDNPTAEAGRPIPVLFGEMTIKSPNILWFGNKSTVIQKVKM